MREIWWVGLGGFVGANARYLLGGWIATRFGTTFPLGTFVINITGSFVLGVIMGLLDAHLLSSTIRLAVAIGFVGAYTTFSTFSYETIRLVENGSMLLATANVFGSVIVGLLATIVGLAAGRGL
ncbi:MAG: fluoride efflux transporter CrcB [Candidatus Binatia bacterium]